MELTDNKVLAGVIVAVVAVAGWLVKHLTNSKKHPCTDDIVFRDVCEANRECIEGSIKDLKELINTRFTHIEELIKSGH